MLCTNTMSKYHEFSKTRYLQIKEEHPEYKCKTIRQMISDEWRQHKGAGASITARKTTMQYEVNKTLINRVEKYDVSESQEISDIVNSKSCSYCDKELKRKSTGDHFIPVVANSKTPLLTNFSSLTIPCCSECNSSKANKTWQAFTLSKEIPEEKINNLKLLQECVDQNTTTYVVDQKQYDELSQFIQEYLEKLRCMTEQLTITKVEVGKTNDITG